MQVPMWREPELRAGHKYYSVNDVEYARRVNEVLALKTIATALVHIVNHLENQEIQ